jgi:REP element-mobilizing transposase RayT
MENIANCKIYRHINPLGRASDELLREISRNLAMTIYAGTISWDHVHMLLGLPRCQYRRRFNM